jgi:hypothetical protein
MVIETSATIMAAITITLSFGMFFCIALFVSDDIGVDPYTRPPAIRLI